MSEVKRQKQHKAEAFEVPNDADIDVMAQYDLYDPHYIEDRDPSKEYFFAADDGDKSRPDGVQRVKQLGYTISQKNHNSADCVLMECPKEIVQRRRQWKLDAIRRRNHSVNTQESFKSAAGQHYVE